MDILASPPDAILPDGTPAFRAVFQAAHAGEVNLEAACRWASQHPPVSVTQASHMTGIAPRTIHTALTKGGEYPGAFKVGTQWVLAAADVMRRGPKPVGWQGKPSS